jgi:hypothetical protein
LALAQVSEQRIGQKRLRLSIVGPLELVVASRHVLDQVLHPEQRVASISHHRVFLHSNEIARRIAKFRLHADLEATKPQAFSGWPRIATKERKSKDHAVTAKPPTGASQPVRRPKLE